MNIHVPSVLQGVQCALPAGGAGCCRRDLQPPRGPWHSARRHLIWQRPGARRAWPLGRLPRAYGSACPACASVIAPGTRCLLAYNTHKAELMCRCRLTNEVLAADELSACTSNFLACLFSDRQPTDKGNTATCGDGHCALFGHLGESRSHVGTGREGQQPWTRRSSEPVA